MPIYEYQCKKCRKIHEIWQKMSDKPAGKCPDCGGPLHKLISLSSFQLKGGGWYVDGYSSVPTDKGNGKESESPSAAGAKAEADSAGKVPKNPNSDKDAASQPANRNAPNSGTPTTAITTAK